MDYASQVPALPAELLATAAGKGFDVGNIDTLDPVYSGGFPTPGLPIGAGPSPPSQLGFERQHSAPVSTTASLDRAQQLYALAAELDNLRQYQALASQPAVQLPTPAGALESLLLGSNALQSLGLAGQLQQAGVAGAPSPLAAGQGPALAGAASLLTPEALQALGLVTLQQSLLAAQRAAAGGEYYGSGACEAPQGRGGQRYGRGQQARGYRDEREEGYRGGRRGKDGNRNTPRRQDSGKPRKGGHVIPRAPSWADASWNPKNGVVVDDNKPDTGVFLPGHALQTAASAPPGCWGQAPDTPVRCSSGEGRAPSGRGRPNNASSSPSSPTAPASPSPASPSLGSSSPSEGSNKSKSPRGYCSDTLPTDWTY